MHTDRECFPLTMSYVHICVRACVCLCSLVRVCVCECVLMLMLIHLLECIETVQQPTEIDVCMQYYFVHTDAQVAFHFGSIETLKVRTHTQRTFCTSTKRVLCVSLCGRSTWTLHANGEQLKCSKNEKCRKRAHTHAYARNMIIAGRLLCMHWRFSSLFSQRI